MSSLESKERHDIRMVEDPAKGKQNRFFPIQAHEWGSEVQKQVQGKKVVHAVDARGTVNELIQIALR